MKIIDFLFFLFFNYSIWKKKTAGKYNACATLALFISIVGGFAFRKILDGTEKKYFSNSQESTIMFILLLFGLTNFLLLFYFNRKRLLKVQAKFILDHFNRFWMYVLTALIYVCTVVLFIRSIRP